MVAPSDQGLHRFDPQILRLPVFLFHLFCLWLCRFAATRAMAPNAIAAQRSLAREAGEAIVHALPSPPVAPGSAGLDEEPLLAFEPAPPDPFAPGG